MSSQLPLILLPGMGADPRFFEAQAKALANVVAPAWIEPEQRESLASYARRWAGRVDPGGPCLLGGCSLGGMIALEMAPHLQAKACLLISSIRSPDELPRRYRILRPAAAAVTQPLRAMPIFARVVRAAARRLLGRQHRPVLEQLADSEGRFLQWAAWAVLTWNPPPTVVPVVQIHGRRDHVLPHRLTHPDVLVPGGGHVLPVTHPREVNDFLRSQVERLT